MANEIRYPVTQSFLPPLPEYIDEIKSIWESRWLTNQGVKHKKLEESLASYLGVPHITLFANGHLALDVAIKALGLTGEVITTPFSFASTTHAITMNGLVPVFCDIKASDYTIDESKIETLITSRTSAIVAVHVYGNPCAVDTIDRIAKKHNLKIIYDAAHSFGELINGEPIAKFGDVSMFSFHATKVFHTIEGGALAFSDSTMQRQFDLFKNFGITGPETVEAVGLNAKMNEFQAAMGIVNLRYIDREISKRQTLVERYIQNLSNVVGLRIPQRDVNVRYNNSYFPILIDEKTTGVTRNDLFDRLSELGILTRKYFFPLIPDFQCYSKQYSNIFIPVAREVSKSVLTLPLYGELMASDCNHICGEIIKLIQKN